MGNEWGLEKLGNLLEITSSKRIFRSDYCESGVPFYRSKEVIERAKGNKISTELFISEDKYNEIKDKYGAPATDDLLLTSVGTLGVAYLVGEDDRFYFKDGNLTWFRSFSERLLPQYLLYWFRSNIAKRKIDEITIGSTQQALTIVSLKSLELTLPPLPEQKAIAHVLGTLDDRIELNRRMNETLEAMAQALFKSWFVDFDPVIDNGRASGKEIPAELSDRAAARAALGDKRQSLPAEIRTLFPAEFTHSTELGWIPTGWKVGTLGEIAILGNGKKSPVRTDGTIPVFGSNGIIGYCIDHNREDVIIVGRVGTYCGSLFFHNSKCWVTDNAMSAEMLEKKNNLYLLELLKTARLNDRRGGSGQPLLNQSILRSIRVLKSSNKLVSEFSSLATSFYNKLFSNEESIHKLSHLRDTLLPKLLSGELRIPEAEKMVEELAL